MAAVYHMYINFSTDFLNNSGNHLGEAPFKRFFCLKKDLSKLEYFKITYSGKIEASLNKQCVRPHLRTLSSQKISTLTKQKRRRRRRRKTQRACKFKQDVPTLQRRWSVQGKRRDLWYQHTRTFLTKLPCRALETSPLLFSLLGVSLAPRREIRGRYIESPNLETE